MASGIGASSECTTVFQDLKLGKKYRYIVFTINSDLTEIVVDKKSPEGFAKSGNLQSQYEEFIGLLSTDQCRWAVYDFEYEKGDAGKRNKICFYSWSPDDAKIKQKMLFASSKDALRRSLVGIHAEIQGTDFDEIAYDTVLDKVSRGA